MSDGAWELLVAFGLFKFPLFSFISFFKDDFCVFTYKNTLYIEGFYTLENVVLTLTNPLQLTSPLWEWNVYILIHLCPKCHLLWKVWKGFWKGFVCIPPELSTRSCSSVSHASYSAHGCSLPGIPWHGPHQKCSSIYTSGGVSVDRPHFVY